MKTFGLVLVSVALILGGCSETKSKSASASKSPVQRHEPTPVASAKSGVTSPDPKSRGTSPDPKSHKSIEAAGPETKAAPTEAHVKHPRVEFTTNHGKIVVELNPDKAPKSVANFLSYVKAGYYSGTIFHRVIAGFMIQGGGFTADMVQKPTRAPVQNEADNGLKNTRGTLAMARTNVPHSATSQFFVNVVDNGFLNHRSKTPRGWGYTVFGHVTEGMGVVDKIRRVPTGARDVPNTPVVIQKARIL
jgi:peptidyl-prolyl cis-trans isomerase B (cyclophilin B)